MSAWAQEWSERRPSSAAAVPSPGSFRGAYQAPGPSSRPDTRQPMSESEATGSMPRNLASLTDDQLYSIIMTMDPPASTPGLTGGGDRQPPVSLAAAADAIRSAKIAIGAKSAGREQGDDASNSDDEDFNPRGRGGKNKRVMANRQSAQRSRLRKLQYINDLEANVTKLQSEIGEVGPQLSFLREKHAGLVEQNQKLRDRVASLMQETQYKDAVNRALKIEVTRMITSGVTEGPPGGQEQQRHPSFQECASTTEGFAAPAPPLQFNSAMQ